MYLSRTLFVHKTAQLVIMNKKGKFKVTGEAVQRWVRRHRDGDSFTKIADDEELDRRTVARAVRDFEKNIRLEEAAGARRDLGTRYLGEHFNELRLAAGYLLDSVRLKLPSIPSPEEVHRDLINCLENWFGDERERHQYRVKPLDDAAQHRIEWLEKKSSRVRATAVAEELRGHFPDLPALLLCLKQAKTDGEREKYLKQLQEKLTPWRLQKTLLETRCQSCPAP